MIWIRNANKTKGKKKSKSQAQTTFNGTYHIVSALNPSMGLDVKLASTWNRAGIQLYSNRKDQKQAFDITSLENGYIRIINKNSGLALEVNHSQVSRHKNIQNIQEQAKSSTPRIKLPPRLE